MLLLKAVNHAKDIEESNDYRGLLGITCSLTSPELTLIHTLSMIFIYGTIFILTISLTAVFWKYSGSGAGTTTGLIIQNLTYDLNPLTK